jgi:hypothetical protein
MMMHQIIMLADFNTGDEQEAHIAVVELSDLCCYTWNRYTYVTFTGDCDK